MANPPGTLSYGGVNEYGAQGSADNRESFREAAWNPAQLAYQGSIHRPQPTLPIVQPSKKGEFGNIKSVMSGHQGGFPQSGVNGNAPGLPHNAGPQEASEDEATEEDRPQVSEEGTETEDEQGPVSLSRTVQPATAAQFHPTSAVGRPAVSQKPQAAAPSNRQPLGHVAAAVAASAKAEPAGAEKGSGTDTDEDGMLIREAKQQVAVAAVKPAPKKRPPAGPPKPRAGSVTLKLLIDEKIIWPGENVLSMEYKNQMTLGTLTPDGRITCNVQGTTMTFESPSAFSIFFKRLVNPDRKADDGWKTVKFAGKFLDAYKLQLARRRFGQDGSGATNSQQQQQPPAGRPASPSVGPAPSSPGMSAPPAKKLKTDPGASGVRPASNSTAYPMDGQHPPRQPGHAPAANGQEVRAKRQVKLPARLAATVHDEHQMVPCQAYGGAPGDGGPRSQPFRVEVAPAAELMMDFHAHLCYNEVIGVLAGSYDAAARVLRVQRAYPVREVLTSDDSINVEMDPEDEVRMREVVCSRPGWQVVGWYHSHPDFLTMPSIIDIANQVRQQHGHRTEAGAEPYVGAIVGPYYAKHATAASSLSWFYVDHAPGQLPPAGIDPRREGCTPMAIQVEAPSEAAVPTDTLAQRDMQDLARRYAAMPSRADLAGEWRWGKSRLDKLKASLATRLPSDWPGMVVSNFLAKLEQGVRAAWEAVTPDQPPPPAVARLAGSEPWAPPAEEPESDVSISDTDADEDEETASEGEGPGAGPGAAGGPNGAAMQPSSTRAARGDGLAGLRANGPGHSGAAPPQANRGYERARDAHPAWGATQAGYARGGVNVGGTEDEVHPIGDDEDEEMESAGRVPPVHAAHGAAAGYGGLLGQHLQPVGSGDLGASSSGGSFEDQDQDTEDEAAS